MLTVTNIGSDLECFIYNKELKKHIPAVGRIGGSKEDPFPISSDGHKIQEDNVMVEFNIPPSTDPVIMFEDINFVLEYLRENRLEKTEDLLFNPSAEFTEDDLNSSQAKVFGCDPDFNVWTEKTNKPPSPKLSHRFSGGHIHLEIQTEIPGILALVKAMDIFHLIPFVAIDKDETRRKFYGKPGNFRIKRYGVEYRSPSNYWANKLEYIEMVHNSINEAIDFLNNGGDPDKYKEDIFNIVLNNDSSKAKSFKV